MSEKNAKTSSWGEVDPCTTPTPAMSKCKPSLNSYLEPFHAPQFSLETELNILFWFSFYFLNHIFSDSYAFFFSAWSLNIVFLMFLEVLSSAHFSSHSKYSIWEISPVPGSWHLPHPISSKPELSPRCIPYEASFLTWITHRHLCSIVQSGTRHLPLTTCFTFHSKTPSFRDSCTI